MDSKIREDMEREQRMEENVKETKHILAYIDLAVHYGILLETEDKQSIYVVTDQCKEHEMEIRNKLMTAIDMKNDPEDYKAFLEAAIDGLKNGISIFEEELKRRV